MSPARLQAEFFARMADPQALRAIFEHLPGVFFFVKDAQGRHIAANSVTFARFGIQDERELIGAMDERFFPAEWAEAFREDDQKVIRSGKPLINRLEVWYDEQRNLDWFLTTKLPLRDRSGRVIGVMGITRRDEDRMRHHDVREVTAAVQHARKNCDQNLTTAELARAAGVSERHLHRKLRATLGLTPHELLLRTRIQSAAEALVKTSTPISEIAIAHGFCDQSAFTQQFRKRTGTTPRQFRVRNRG
ncbi:MAG: helix-turn-helix domain-containing protein [Chthoniobacter sp.]|uniref:AraC family transcriptional regulator n=1 Tax=Chthoniobacter sp. TaxID=2510640 RepID=UPI0032AB4411